MARARNRAWRYLEQKRRGYWFKIGIPAKVQDQFGGKTHFRQNLHTSDIKVAMARRDELEPDVKAMFEATASGVELKASERGALWRDALRQQPEDWNLIQDLAQEEAERLKDDKDRLQFTNAFTGKVRIGEHLDAYLSAIKLADKTTNERRGLVMRFDRWCETEGLRLPDIDRKVAGRYVEKVIGAMHRRTGKKHLTALTGYWDFLNRRGHVERFEPRDNPWRDQMEPERRKKVTREDREEEERPFTDDEVKALLGGTPIYRGQTDRALYDMIRVAALSGMRLGEIAGLWAEECSGDVFDIQEAKTDAGARKVPIHPDLKEIVKRRTEGRNDHKAPLFAELAGMKNAADTMGKRFKRFREDCEVDDRREGRRRSLVNFHSFRRWFVTKAEQAGQSENVVAAVVGHAEGERKKKITFGVYSEGPSLDQRRACVEAVRLPKLGAEKGA